MRISDWSSDVCSSDLTRDCARHRIGVDIIGGAVRAERHGGHYGNEIVRGKVGQDARIDLHRLTDEAQIDMPFDPRIGVGLGAANLLGDDEVCVLARQPHRAPAERSDEHTSELQSLMRISYAVFGYIK